MAGAPLPDYEIDGRDVWPLISGAQGAENPHSFYAFTTARDFEAVLSGDGRWKLHLPHTYWKTVSGGKDGFSGNRESRQIGYSLFDMLHDPFEKVNVIEQYPEIAEKLRGFAASHQKKFFEE